ncbi:hypothetical protein HK105_203967 [Polyrhizophydium stewartii]|uniref:RRM domain-containing protein n=1 Tax=Polyrhizophydium stewartii TaxID=2732419 RepID=A0ABR4NAR8_9FUNG
MSRIVFVGNISYDLTEPQLVELFSQVGTVLSFRLVFDRDTGKPKGYGFCTFPDHVTAASAVRNLHNHDLGGRPLRVAFADAERDDPEYEAARRMESQQPLRVLQGVTASEAVSQAVGSFQAPQLAELLGHLKAGAALMLQTTPENGRTLLSQNPQLAYGIFQALLAMNALDQFTMQARKRLFARSWLSNYLEEQQKQLLLQVLHLTPEQISALPPEQQQQIHLLRAQVLGS